MATEHQLRLFESQLARLKECTGAKEDQEVAQLLGMTKAAFSYRKRTANFPEEKLVALKAADPEIDLQYILFGERFNATDRREHDEFLRAASDLGLKPTAVARVIVGGLTDGARGSREEAIRVPVVAGLIDTLAWCDDEAIRLIAQVAARMSGDTKTPWSQRAVDPLGSTGVVTSEGLRPLPKRRGRKA